MTNWKKGSSKLVINAIAKKRSYAPISIFIFFLNVIYPIWDFIFLLWKDRSPNEVIGWRKCVQKGTSDKI